MPNEDGLFTQAEVDKILRERLKPEKGKLDTARDEAAHQGRTREGEQVA